VSSILTPSEREALISLCAGRKRFKSVALMDAIKRARRKVRDGVPSTAPRNLVRIATPVVASSSVCGQMGVARSNGGATDGA
jgi:hypothetical protein